MAETKLSKLRELLSEGAIAAFYTLNGWFVKVKLAFDIDRVCFAFVKKGTNGSENLDIYVDTNAFDEFCDQILNGQMQKKCAEDKGDFPTAWVYTTGKNGCKSVSFGTGKQNFCFQGRETEQKKEGDKVVTKTKQNAFVGVGSWQEMRDMAKAWKRFSKPYYEELTEILYAAVQRNASFHNNDADALSEQTVNESVPFEDAPAAPAPTSEKVSNETPKTPNAANPVSLVKGNAELYTLTPMQPMEKAENYSDAKPSYTLRCNCKELESDIEVVFLSAPIGKQAANFNMLKDRIDTGWRGSFRIEGQISEYKGREQLRFTTFIKKGA